MRLSEAIRLGSMLGPQVHGQFDRTHRKYVFFGPVITEYCALGSAYAAIGGGSHIETATTERAGFRGVIKVGDQITMMDTPPEWGQFFWSSIACPQCGIEKDGKQLIPHLNDDHKWTREAIACFVEATEQAQSTSRIEPVAVEKAG